MAVAAKGFNYAYWKGGVYYDGEFYYCIDPDTGTPILSAGTTFPPTDCPGPGGGPGNNVPGPENKRVMADVIFDVNADDVPGRLFDDNKDEQFVEARGFKPEIRIATIQSFVVPVAIDNIVNQVKFAGFDFTLEILDNDTPGAIFLSPGTGTNPGPGGTITGTFAESISGSTETLQFNVNLDPNQFLCQLEEQARLVAENRVLKVGFPEETTYVNRRIRTVTCKRTTNELTEELKWPQSIVGEGVDANIQVIRTTRHFTACYNTYRNVIIEHTEPAIPPTTLQILTFVPPTLPSNLEEIMTAVIPIKMTRTVEQFAQGSGIFGKDVVKFNLIIRPEELQDIVVS